MTLWGRLRNIMPGWHSSTSPPENATDSTADHLELARESLSELLDDSRVPEAVRQSLASDYDEVQKMLDKITHGHIHIAVFGRVSVGKSALLNALLGQTRFATSPLHGETRTSQSQLWQEYHAGNTYLIDTPGIDEIDGDARAQLARSVAARADLILFVIDGDLTNTELEALRELRTLGRPLLLVLNKTDRYTAAQLTDLQAAISAHIQEIVSPDNFLLATADPAPQVVITINENGSESESQREIPVDIEQVQQRIWEILDAEGKTLAAMNASLFASHLSDQVGVHLLEARRKVGQKLIRVYCVSKGVAVALNPIPVTDLVAALAVDISMIVHLSSVYNLPLSRNEATDLIKTIGGQMILLMGTVWAVHLVSSALKLGTGGLSSLVTGGAQGLVAYYSTYVVGQAAERYLAQGKSWGTGGPKYVVREILDNLDRDSILEQAREDIRLRLGMKKTA